MTGLYVASNPTALTAQFQLTRNMGGLTDTLTRLSTGLRINSGKDDPAGLIASELLKADITGTNKAITNTERANSLIATADSALGQVGNLLNDIKGLVVEAANTGAMSSDQIAANQLQIDASIDAIDRISRTTTYGGQKLLDGSLDFTTDSCGGNTGFSNLQINSANFGTADSVGVNVKVQEAAKRGTLEYYGTGVDQTTTMDITGSVGTKSFTFGAGTTNAEIATAINGASDSTGVQARVEGEAARGSVTLSSAGSNNDIVVTANEMGLDAGNYTFRITQGAENDARIVTEAAGGTPGVVEISLKESYEANYTDFAGLFNIAIDGQYAVDAGLTAADGTTPLTAAQAETSISITRGDANSVSFYSKDSAAVASTKDGKSLTASVTTEADDFHMSQLNGWTVVIDDSLADGTNQIFQDNKTLRINSTDAATASNISDGLMAALGVADAEFELAFSGNPLVNGDTLTFKGGGDAGELAITYKEGATASDILKMVNNAPYTSASLAKGAEGSTLIPALPANKTYVSTTQADPDAPTDLNTASRYTSSATSQDVIDLINSKLGDKFSAAALSGDGTGGRVSYMDAAVDYGSVNLDNALRFTGMDNGPVVRLTTTGADGKPVANQALGVNIIQPSEADIKAGIHTPILEVRLATDASGNSITTAADIAKLFDNLTAEETLGVSAEVLYPPGVDPNGRTWVDDGCGNITPVDGCPEPFGQGIVQPTGVPGECEVAQNDLVMLGANQDIVDDYAVARIKSGTAIEGTAAVAGAGALNSDGVDMTTGGATSLTFGNTSALNGMTFAFTTHEGLEGFDESTGKLTVFIDPVTAAMDPQDDAAADAAFAAIVNGAIAANWEGIRAYTGAVGDPVKLDSTSTDNEGQLVNALADAAAGLTIGIDASNGAAASAATRGVATDDPAMTITAKNKGTDMAGVKIYFVNDRNATDLTAYDISTWDGASLEDLDAFGTPDIKVDYATYEDGSRALIVTANIVDGATETFGSMISGQMLADALNANSTFNTYFEADAALTNDAASSMGGVEFLTDPTQAAAQTVGGYRIDSPGVSGSNYTGTSSGIGMTGQSDDNQKLILEATEVGSDNFVKVYVAEGSFDTYCPLGIKMCELAGTDVVATINGNKTSAKGNDISINTADLSMSMTVDGDVGESSFNITGGGALFQLGSDVVSTNQMRLGIGSVSSTHLGGSSGKLFQLKSGGSADLSSDEKMKLADRIVNEAISSVATTRGRLGAIQKSSLEPNINALQDTLVALTEAEASISNADFAEESSNLTQYQLLIQSGMSALGIANQLPQYAASLVG